MSHGYMSKTNKIADTLGENKQKMFIKTRIISHSFCMSVVSSCIPLVLQMQGASFSIYLSLLAQHQNRKSNSVVMSVSTKIPNEDSEIIWFAVQEPTFLHEANL